MSCIRSLVAVSFFASIGFSTAVTAQEMISDTTARKQPLTTWGVQFEEFEYRYSDDDEEPVSYTHLTLPTICSV